jgi:hypothetical protein
VGALICKPAACRLQLPPLAGAAWSGEPPAQRAPAAAPSPPPPAPQGTWKLRSAEDIFAALEDNSVALSSMKASKFYLVFEKVGAHPYSSPALAG